MKTRRTASKGPMSRSKPERMESMKGHSIAHRDPLHQDTGGSFKHEAHSSYGSPASVGASKGPGPLPGAGELPHRGPGPGAKGKIGRDTSETPMGGPASSATPKGMRVYREE
jgi:hypothetical protein